VQHRCGCSLDQGYVSKQEKKAQEKRDDAARAWRKQQRTVERANRKIDERIAREQRRIDRANAHLNHEVAEFLEVNGPSEAVAEAKAVEPEPEIERAKPAEPEPVIEPTPAPTVEPTVEPTPAPIPEAAIIVVAPVEKPKALPKTSSDITLIGLIGLVSTMTGYMTRFFRS